MRRMWMLMWRRCGHLLSRAGGRQAGSGDGDSSSRRELLKAGPMKFDDELMIDLVSDAMMKNLLPFYTASAHAIFQR